MDGVSEWCDGGWEEHGFNVGAGEVFAPGIGFERTGPCVQPSATAPLTKTTTTPLTGTAMRSAYEWGDFGHRQCYDIPICY